MNACEYLLLRMHVNIEIWEARRGGGDVSVDGSLSNTLGSGFCIEYLWCINSSGSDQLSH